MNFCYRQEKKFPDNNAAQLGINLARVRFCLRKKEFSWINYDYLFIFAVISKVGIDFVQFFLPDKKHDNAVNCIEVMKNQGD